VALALMLIRLVDKHTWNIMGSYGDKIFDLCGMIMILNIVLRVFVFRENSDEPHEEERMNHNGR
jgi:hypothetical protein